MEKNQLQESESDQKMLGELKELFEFVSPNVLRRNLEDLFFLHIISSDEIDLPNQKQFISNFYHLINFLNEIESHERY